MAARALSPRSPGPGGGCRRLQVGFPEPGAGRGARGGSSDPPPPTPGTAGGGCGSADSPGLPSRRWSGEEGQCPDVPSGAGTGVGDRGRGPASRRASGTRASGEPRAGTGRGPARAGRGGPGWGARVHAAVIGSAGLMERSWPIERPLVTKLTRSSDFAFAKISFPMVGRRGDSED